MVPLYSATLALSAALVFMVQPMLARFMLPLAGGTPAVWATAMAFFTTALLVGYLYAHWSTKRLGVRRQAVVHVALAAAALALLPVGLPDGSAPPAASTPTWWVLGTLTVAAGLPFVLLSTTAPLLQRWLAGTTHKDAGDPYFLYRASNVGSLLGLLAYPLVVEPALSLDAQARLWSIGYVALLVLLALSAVALLRAPRATAPEVRDPTAPPVSWAQRASWTAIAFVPSSLMLGVTSFMTVDLAPIPLLWVLPLALYLLSFVVAFGRGTRSADLVSACGWIMPFCVVGLAIGIGFEDRSPLWGVLSLHLLTFFVVAVVCHGRLNAARPAAARLTEFYAWVAVGGALGAVFNALVAPNVFEGLTEYPLALALACLCLPLLRLPARTLAIGGVRLELGEPGVRSSRSLDLTLPLSLGAAAAVGVYLVDDRDVVAFLAAAACLLCVLRPLRFGLAVGAVMAGMWVPALIDSTVIYRDRSFFGVREVQAGNGGVVRSLMNGTTLHGLQILTPQLARTPLTYYHRTGPLGQLLRGLPDRNRAQRAAMIGLGTGSSACLARERDRWTFFEIDPAVAELAADPALFSYLRDCPGAHDVVLGDARLTLDERGDGEFGLMAFDAFNSDAIPYHLLTRDAVRGYLDKLAAGGTMAFHVSNRYLELEPVLANVAASLGLACVAQLDTNVTERTVGKSISHWVVLARRDADLGRADRDRRWHACARNDDRVWTDDYSNLLGAMT